MELFRISQKKTTTERTCRGASREAGIYAFNPKAVLDEVPLKDIEKGRLGPTEVLVAEPTTGMKPAAVISGPPPCRLPPSPSPPPPTAVVPMMPTVTPKQKAKARVRHPLPTDNVTPHNTAAVQYHVLLFSVSSIAL